MKKCLLVFMLASVVVGALGVSAAPAEARGGGWGRVYIGGGIGFYGAVAPYWYGYPAYAYPYPAYGYPVYVAPYAYSEYAAPAPAPAPAPSYWYFCRSSNAYYPHAAACPEGWQQVPAIPPG